jgi:hypothetical protein
VLQLIGTPYSSQVQSRRFFLTGAITPVKKYLQTWFIVFCSSVNACLLMVRPNKTKPEGYMQPLTVPGGYPHTLHCSRTPWPGFESRPGYYFDKELQPLCRFFASDKGLVAVYGMTSSSAF